MFRIMPRCGVDMMTGGLTLMGSARPMMRVDVIGADVERHPAHFTMTTMLLYVRLIE